MIKFAAPGILYIKRDRKLTATVYGNFVVKYIEPKFNFLDNVGILRKNEISDLYGDVTSFPL